MKYDRLGFLGRFRGKRAIFPLLGVAVALFLALGGYKVIAGFAMDEVTGFLVGTEARGDHPQVAQATAPKLTAQVKAATKAAPEPAQSPAAATAAAPATAPVPAAPTPPPAAISAPASSAESLAKAVPAVEDSTAIRKKMQVYTASYLRDPFYSLIQVGKDRPAKLLDVGQAKMVGSVWGESGIIALLEDESGRSFALKVGDRVVNGKVISVTPASVTFSITTFDLTKNVTLELAGEGE
ncbi:MAG TPA: hypothetical protein VMU02_00165 [bacterium]|nr:hypothetical protein [bacterium]